MGREELVKSLFAIRRSLFAPRFQPAGQRAKGK
jgi:hypothetical protein